jgi:hypothetical protein
MKAFLIPGLALTLLTGSAFAQASGQPPAPPPQGAVAPSPPPPPAAPGVAATQPPAPPARGAAPPSPPPGGPEAGADDMGAPPPPPPGGPGPRGQRPPPPPPSRAAHFRLQRGDAMVDVKCADDEQMKVCADLTLQMVDRLQTTLKP